MNTFRDPMKERPGTKVIFQAALRSAAILAVLSLWGCGGGEEVRTAPEEILDSVKISDPSVLGYVRADAGGLQLLVGFLENFLESDPFRQARDLEERLGGVPGANLLFSSLPVDMMRKVAPLTEPGSHMTVVLLDPGIFGGGAALHFVPERGKSLVAVLEAAENYQRVGDSPPEFRLMRARHPFRVFLQALKQIDIDLEIPGDDYDLRFIVEESDEGVLVVPSYDARRDVVAFLRSTDFLSPWGDAGLVIDLDMERLAMAYADLIRSLDLSIRKIAAKLDAAADPKVPLSAGRILRFWSATVLGFLGGLDGVRYVSRLPGTGAAELRVLAVEGGSVDRFLGAMREDGPAMLGLMPGGFALEINTDPEAFAALIPAARDFYAEMLQMDRAALDPVTDACVQALEFSAGRHLWGVNASREAALGAWVAVLEEGAETAVLEERAFATSSSIARLRGREIDRASDRERGAPMRFDVFPGLLTVEGGARGNKWVTTFLYDPGKTSGENRSAEKWSKQLFGLARMGAPPPAGLPRKAHLFVNFRLMPLGDAALRALGMFMSLGFSGYGQVDGNELIVTFPNR